MGTSEGASGGSDERTEVGAVEVRTCVGCSTRVPGSWGYGVAPRCFECWHEHHGTEVPVVERLKVEKESFVE